MGINLNVYSNNATDVVHKTKTNAVYNSGDTSIEGVTLDDMLVNIAQKAGDINFICDEIEPTTTNFVPGEKYSHEEAFQRTANLFGGTQNEISDINSKLGNCTAVNPAADRAFVNSSIATNAANFRGNWQTWSDVPNDSSLYPEDYSGSRIPTNNDYLVIQETVDYGEEYTGQWRFMYIGDWETKGKSGWVPQYRVGSAFTAQQTDAINSGINATKVAKYDRYDASIRDLKSDKLDKVFSSGKKIYGVAGNGAQIMYKEGENVHLNDDGTISATDTIYDDTEIREAIATETTRRRDEDASIRASVELLKSEVIDDENVVSEAINKLSEDIENNKLFERGTGEHSIQTKDTGCQAVGDYSFAEGRGSVAMGMDSHVEGNETKTMGDAAFAHAEGFKTNAYGQASHAEGGGSVAHNDYAHAEGGGTTALGFSSHTEGNSTIANNPYEHAEGFYNESHYAGYGKEPYPYGDGRNTIHSIGIGTGLQDHKNAFEVMQNGDIYIIGVGGYDGKNFEAADTVQDTIETLLNKGEIENGGDLNDYTISGIYHVNGGDSILNLPPDMSNSYGQLFVLNGNNDIYPTQIFSVEGDDNNDIWYRKGVDGEWLQWTKIATGEGGAAIKPFELDIEEADDIEFFDNGDNEGNFYQNNEKYYKISKSAKFEFDLTQLVPSNNIKESIDNLINEQGSLAWAFNAQTDDDNYYIDNGLVVDINSSDFNFSLESIEEQYPHLYIESVDIVCERVSKTGATTTIQVGCDDYQDTNSGWVRRGISDNEISFTVDRHSLYTEVEDPEDPSKVISVPVDAMPLDYVGFSVYKTTSEDGDLIRFKKISFNVCSVDSEEDYWGEAQHELFYLKSITEEEIISSIVPTEENSESLYRLKSNELLVTDKSNLSKPQYKKISSIEEIVDGDYLIGGNGNFVMSSYLEEESSYTIDSETEIYKEDDIIPINEDQTEEYLHNISFNIHYDGSNIHIKSNFDGNYIGYTGSKNGINTNISDIFTNTVSIVDGNITITCEGSGASTLQHNSGGHLFRFYKSAQKPISLYKKIGSNPYSWNKVIRETELHRISKSGDYNDLSNKPIIPEVGDAIIKNYDVLPRAGAEYMNIIARCNHKLYDIDFGEGWNLNPIGFSNAYPTMSGSSAESQLRQWMIDGLGVSDGMVSVNFFNQSQRLSCANTVGRGIQIGANGNTGEMRLRLSNKYESEEEEIVGSEYKTSKISLTLEQYGNETSHAIISFGNSYSRYYEATRIDEETGEEVTYTETEDIYEELGSRNVDFEYSEEDPTIKSVDLDIDMEEIGPCNTIIISTEIIGEYDRGRVVLSRFEFENLAYYRNPDDEDPIIFNSRYKWVTMSGDALSAGPGIEISNGKIINTLDGKVLEKTDGKAISEAIYRIKTEIGLDENLKPIHNIESQNITEAIRDLNDANETISDGFYKLRTELGLNRYLEANNFDYNSLLEAIVDLKNRIEQLENR